MLFASFSRTARLFLSVIVGLAVVCGVALAEPQTTGDRLLQFCDRSVDWYHRIATLAPTPINSQDLLLRDSTRDSARLAIGRLFTFARLQANLLPAKDRPSSQPAKGPAVQLPKMMADTDAQIGRLQQAVEDAAVVAQNAHGPAVDDARAKQYRLQAQLNLANAQSTALHNYADFLASGGEGGSTLIDRIDDLQRTIPETATTRPAETVPSGFTHDSGGLLSTVSEIFDLTGRMATLIRLANETEQLQKQNDALHDPVRDQILGAIKQGQALSSTTLPSTSTTEINHERDTLNSLAGQIKQFADLGLSISQQRLDLDSTRRELLNWRSALETQYVADVRAVVVRIGITGLIVLIIVVVSELWRRATYRYVHDARRRRQLMLVRRIVIGVIFLLVIIASVATEFGSLATFAGLITAGIAVSLQTVILSGVAYFFFIGRFGVRVGDRVTVAGITGDVVEVGLFRLYLMELSGQKGDLHSTGRMIVFSNAVLFQPSAFYKQLPGTDYVWHEVAMTLSPDGDHLLAEKRLTDAVNGVVDNFRPSLQQQYQRAMDTLHITIDPPRVEGRLRFVDTGVEYVIRYPAELERASAIDDQITRALLTTISQEPKLTFANAATPRIQVNR